eukprot:GHVR01067294.1.p2 GENE.GHVR01067294.1~~GHVR01067294.1.p2  ORF type:complete len:119 (-),score=33.64 GHVR01067294.1:876-1232(-)
MNSRKDKLTQKILFGITYGIYELYLSGELEADKDSNPDVVGRITTAGFAHCDININSILIDTMNVVVLTGYLGKQLNDDNTYALRMDTCNGSGDVKYFSPRRTALHMAKTIVNSGGIQ